MKIPGLLLVVTAAAFLCGVIAGAAAVVYGYNAETQRLTK